MLFCLTTSRQQASAGDVPVAGRQAIDKTLFDVRFDRDHVVEGVVATEIAVDALPRLQRRVRDRGQDIARLEQEGFRAPTWTFRLPAGLCLPAATAKHDRARASQQCQGNGVGLVQRGYKVESQD
jgi:hypothetical protein